MRQAKLGIVVGGGPAPGINGVIGAAAIEAINNGLTVLGFYDGLSHLVADDFNPGRDTVDLKIQEMSRVHFDGGSILRTSRTNLLDASKLKTSTVAEPDPARVRRVCERLRGLGVTHLLTIGGDDTSLSARFIAEGSEGGIRVVHVPKTIDNDLPLPGDVPTFGFSTARHIGSQIVANLMEDSRTTRRWYVVVAMGRNAGFLALGIGKTAGATLTLIPEEFDKSITIREIADVIEGSMLKRRAMGRPDGVAVLAEGLAYKLGDRAELSRLLGKEVPVDAAGHPRLSEVPLAAILKDELVQRFQARGEKVTIVGHTLGYELRSAPPTPWDMSYTRDLGHGGVRLLLDTTCDLPPGVMATMQAGNLVPMAFEDMVDPVTNRTRIRQVDLSSYSYRVARAYMIRLEKWDFETPTTLAALASEARMTPHRFRERYEYIVREGHWATLSAGVNGRSGFGSPAQPLGEALLAGART
ncbi:MAG TPA: 6-phosphofructokinase [Phycisphaerae bacterium]|nr:6-phosphofructokinase [Phycisphaerae bacterium]HNU45473.1 6-phosphofructokinase [Phycisphaerae bacterium]